MISGTTVTPEREAVARFTDPYLESGQSLVVNTTLDVVSTGDGVNSLREAIICANVTPGADTITVPAGTYTLTIPGAGLRHGSKYTYSGSLERPESFALREDR